MSQIRILDNQTINQIAAGEVIENPASVVKELVENAVDAKASEIVIEIEGGGRDLIRVSDNGIGMNFEDAKLSLERHATSKIRSLDDLFQALTMGFRGEALPSIASISKFSLLTSDGGKACFLLLEGGKLLIESESFRDTGTTIEVKDLFFNVPVRKKFQRSASYDALDISRVVTRLSLANPEIGFILKSNKKTELKVSPEENPDMAVLLAKRAKLTLKEDFAEDGFLFSYKSEEISSYGVLGKPHHARATRASQYLIINGRPVFSASLSDCLKTAYGTLIESQKHPAFLLHLNMPASYLDVNVHPQKREVRIRLLDKLKVELGKAFRETLHGETFDPRPFPFFPLEENEPPSFAKYDFKPSFLSLESFEEKKTLCLPESDSKQDEFNFIQEKPLNILYLYPGFIILEGIYQEGKKTESKGITLINQKAAFERLVYSALQEKQPLDSQILLIPYSFNLPKLEAEFLNEVLADLTFLGISISRIGENRFALEAMPLLLKESALSDFIQEFIQECFGSGKTLSFREKLGKKLSMASVRAGKLREKTLTLEEARYIALNIIKNSNSGYSPSGEPIFMPLSSTETRHLFEKVSKG